LPVIARIGHVGDDSSRPERLESSKLVQGAPP
jgi:hypothetical protein